MSGTNYKALREATRGSVFRVVSVERERCVCWFGGSALVVYDLAGGHIDTITAPLYGGAAVLRREALRMLGKVDDNQGGA